MMQSNRARIDIRCTQKEKEILKELARDRGMTLSEYVRDKIFGRKIVVRVSGKEIK